MGSPRAERLVRERRSVRRVGRAARPQAAASRYRPDNEIPPRQTRPGTRLAQATSAPFSIRRSSIFIWGAPAPRPPARSASVAGRAKAQRMARSIRIPVVNFSFSASFAPRPGPRGWPAVAGLPAAPARQQTMSYASRALGRERWSPCADH